MIQEERAEYRVSQVLRQQGNHRENCTAKMSLDRYHVTMFHSCHNTGSQKCGEGGGHLVLPGREGHRQETCPRSFGLGGDPGLESSSLEAHASVLCTTPRLAQWFSGLLEKNSFISF